MVMAGPLVLKYGVGRFFPAGKMPIFRLPPSMLTKFRYKAGLIFWLGFICRAATV